MKIPMRSKKENKLPLPIVVASDMALQTSGVGFNNPN